MNYGPGTLSVKQEVLREFISDCNFRRRVSFTLVLPSSSLLVRTDPALVTSRRDSAGRAVFFCCPGDSRRAVPLAEAQDLMILEQSRKQLVLIVEDDAMLRGILAESLAGEGFTVLTVENGEEALAIASTLGEQLGLVVTDVLLPGMDGLELANGLASLKPSPPVLFISGVRDHRDMPSPVLLKPFGPNAFLDHVRRLLPRVQHH